MKLIEIAFMCDKIKKSYRRRMLKFVILLTMATTPIAVICVGEVFKGSSIFFGTFAVVMIIAMIIIYFPDHGNVFPWTIKKNHAQTLEDFSKSDFEQLRHSIVLREYFEV
ncbi:MAG: hypothetical protein WCN88_04570 [Candidatus Falkowbacteria bacterium]